MFLQLSIKERVMKKFLKILPLTILVMSPASFADEMSFLESTLILRNQLVDFFQVLVVMLINI